MEKLRQKHVGRNSISRSQIQSMMAFDVDMSQLPQRVTTSNTKIEHLVGTMKTCEMCQSVLMCIGLIMHCRLVLI